MSAVVIGIGVLATPFLLKRFDNKLKELGLSKKDIKILLVIIILYLLRKNFKKELLKTKIMITTHYLPYSMAMSK